MNIRSSRFFTKPTNIFLTAILCTALWGSAIPVIKIGYKAFEITSVPSQILFAGIRFFLSGVIVIIFNLFAYKKFIIPTKKEFTGITLLGLIQTSLQYILFYISLNHLTGVKGSILNASGNFFAVILAHIFLKNDKMTIKKMIGCILGFGGVIICNFESGGFDISFSIQGEGFIILAALSFAAGSIITKFITKDSDSVMITGYQLGIGGIFLIAAGIISGGALTINSVYSLLILLYLSLLSSIAFSLWAQLLKYNYVGKISIYGFLNPIFGVILSGILLGESFINIKTVSALILVCLGILAVNLNKSPKNR